uniref:Uncharacterized protein n=1 Tax=Meloidogyne hapla TaxID=6305 RepID=A0A1I8AYC3_MELHA
MIDKKDEINKLNNNYLLKQFSSKNVNYTLLINKTGGLNNYLLQNENNGLFEYLKIERRRKFEKKQKLIPAYFIKNFCVFQLFFVLFINLICSSSILAQQNNRVQVQGTAEPTTLLQQQTTPQNPGIVEISVNSLDIVNFDTNAFQSRLGVSSNKELIWIGSEFRAAVNTQIQLKMLIERRELFATQQVPLRLEKVRIELVLGPAVNSDGHLRTGKFLLQ